MPRLVALAVSVIAAIVILWFFFLGAPPPAETKYGFTWSVPYARQLGLDPQADLERALETLRPSHVRIPAYWAEIEPVRGTYRFDWLDAQLDAAARYDAGVLLAVGSRLPRWPECWEPEWAARLSDLQERRRVQLAYLRAVYERYKDHPAVVAWQVENEPLYDVYAVCPGMTRELVVEELRFVRRREAERGDKAKPVFTTDSGEWSFWIGYAGETDGLGISVYRFALTRFGTLRHWYFTPKWYWRRAQLLSRFTGPIMISEFQMEPWTLREIQLTPVGEQFNTFSIEQMRKNFRYAERLGFSSISFWGVEWWMWMIDQGHPEFWEEAKVFFEAR